MRFVPSWRPFTWFILAVNVLFPVWIIGAYGGTSCRGDTACEAGTTIGVGIIVGLWVAADIILGLLWLITKPKGRDCPRCGNFVKRGRTQCKNCGYDFAQAASRGMPRPGDPET